MRRITENLKMEAAKVGFDLIGFTDARIPEKASQHLSDFVDAEWYGEMSWMKETLFRRLQPKSMWPEARSAIVLGTNYAPEVDPLARLSKKTRANISVYALNRDYHDVVKGRLKQLAGWFASKTGANVKVFVDTAPLMEKPLAQQAGIGWQGKHTNLVSREFGSWLFLGVILTTAELPNSAAMEDNCGSCTACIDICPTRAIVAPYKLDARLCISYLTIEHKGHIARDLRPLIGNRIYGCDDCLAVCPWNKFAQTCNEPKLVARPDLIAPELSKLAGFDDAAFRRFFSGSPVKRIGRDRFVRNVLIAIGNSGDRNLAPVVEKRLSDPSAVVRAIAVWAISRLVGAKEFEKLKETYTTGELDSDVLKEWNGTP